jgi:DHA1 family tetracycline resistance protein-like MFS transporter
MAKPRLPVLFILITVTLDAMGIGLILPVIPDLIREVEGVSLSDAALWGGILSASYAVMQFGCSPTLGNLSDRFGRRPILLVSMAVLALDYVIMAVAGSIWLLLVGRVVAGGDFTDWVKRRAVKQPPGAPKEPFFCTPHSAFPPLPPARILRT